LESGCFNWKVNRQIGPCTVLYRNGKKQIEIPIKITSSDVVNARGIILTIKEQKLRAIIYLPGDIFLVKP
jgi:hypothetical protein